MSYRNAISKSKATPIVGQKNVSGCGGVRLIDGALIGGALFPVWRLQKFWPCQKQNDGKAIWTIDFDVTELVWWRVRVAFVFMFECQFGDEIAAEIEPLAFFYRNRLIEF